MSVRVSIPFTLSILLLALGSRAAAQNAPRGSQPFQAARAALTSYCEERSEEANCRLALESLPAPSGRDPCTGSIATHSSGDGFFQLRCPSSLVFGILGRQRGAWRPMKVSAFRLYRSTTREYEQANDAFLRYCRSSGDSSCGELLALWDRCPGEYSVGAAGFRMLARECPEKVAFIDFEKVGGRLTVSGTQVIDRKRSP